jgi:hypothetical protein
LADLGEAMRMGEPALPTNENLQPKASAPALPIVVNTQPSTAGLSVAEQIIATWKTDAKIRAEFGSFSSYAAWQTQKACKEAGITMEQYRNEQPNASGYIANLAKAGTVVSEKEKSEIVAYAETWRRSGDIRGEFKSFEAYAAYQRMKAQGRVRT